MKRFTIFLAAAVLLVSFIRVFAAVETFKIDPQHSYVLWHISHFGFSHPSGKWMVEGTLTLDRENPKLSKVNVTIDVAKIITGIPDLDEHLKGQLFFDVEKYPKATFVSNKVEVKSEKRAKVFGMLTVHGVSKVIALNVRLNKIGENPINNKLTVGFTGETQLKRSDFGISTLLPGLGDDVKINIELEAFKENKTEQ